jgi:hypothetical protein
MCRQIDKNFQVEKSAGHKEQDGGESVVCVSVDKKKMKYM